MQVSIYLNDHLVSQIDQVARRTKKTRSRLIQDLLHKLLKTRDDSQSSPWKKAFGMFQKSFPPADEMIHVIRKSRTNRRWDSLPS